MIFIKYYNRLLVRFKKSRRTHHISLFSLMFDSFAQPPVNQSWIKNITYQRKIIELPKWNNYDIAMQVWYAIILYIDIWNWLNISIYSFFFHVLSSCVALYAYIFIIFTSRILLWLSNNLFKETLAFVLFPSLSFL